MIIGLTGPARSGKDTLAGYLVKEYGFKHFDFYRDVFMEEMKKKKLKPTKQNASKLGDELRKKGGRGVMADLLLPKIDVEDAVITGFRSPEEVQLFRSKTAKFHLIMINAPKETRYKRKDTTEKGTFEEFLTRDERDFKNKGMERVFRMADKTIENDGTIEELHMKVNGIMGEIAEMDGRKS